MVNWSQIKDINALKQLGSLKEVKRRISEDLYVDIKSESWASLFRKLENFQQIFGNSQVEVSLSSSSEKFTSELHYFLSEVDRAIFILVETEGSCRQKLLGVTPDHYGDPKLAKQWKISLANLVHPDKTNNQFQSKEAMVNLLNMYREMTGK
jgi:tRNA 2-selenouridine synthase SelU